MHQRLPRRTAWLIAVAAALVAVLAGVPGQASAEPRYEPPCFAVAVCLYENVHWNHGSRIDKGGDGGDQIEFWPGSGRPWREKLWLDPNITRPNASTGASLENRVSSYANNTRVTYCVYDRYRNGRPLLLWEMRPGGSSSWVGRKQVKGKSVNDRADYIEPC
jgi:hypothetical protein